MRGHILKWVGDFWKMAISHSRTDRLKDRQTSGMARFTGSAVTADGFLNVKRSYIIILRRSLSRRRIVGLTSSTPFEKCGAIVAGAFEAEGSEKDERACVRGG